MQTESLLILLAEDDDGHAKLVERNLKRAGILNICRVKDGQEALEFVHRRGPFAGRKPSGPLLLVLDINMPRVDGIEVLRRIKSSEATAKTPVIMLTTTDAPHEIEQCYALGCGIYITKPVKYSAFVEALRRLGLFLQTAKVPREAA